MSKVDALSQPVEKIPDNEKAIENLSEQHDSVVSELGENSFEISSLKKRVDNIESGISPTLKEAIKQMSDIQQYSRRQNLETHGLKLQQKENFLERVNGLAKELELAELTPSDIDGLHRLPSKPKRTPVVIARFSSYTLKKKWIEARSRLTYKEQTASIRFFDNLTATNRLLLWQARTKAKDKRYEFACQRDGHVYVRNAQGENAFPIYDESDLEKIE